MGDGELMLASDVSAIISRTQNVVYLKDGEIVHMTAQNFSITTLDAADVSAVIDKITWNIEDSEVGNYAHFMEKEIFEQPTALENTMRGRFSEDGSTASLAVLTFHPSIFVRSTVSILLPAAALGTPASSPNN